MIWPMAMGGGALHLTVRTTHTGLEAIRTEQESDLVDAQAVEGVHAHAEVN